jgi:peptidoglycan/xylan/chitin deacetylase (PgdA/CDA1 family)
MMMKATLRLSSLLLLVLPLSCSDSEDSPPGQNGVAGTAAAGSAGASGSGGAAGAGGSAQAGAAGVGGSGGSGGAIGEPSGLPAPTTTGVARPAGTVGGLSVVDWAGFRAAATYTLDDGNISQIDNYDALQALGVPFTFYLWGSRPEGSNDVWMRAVSDGHELGNHTQNHLMGTDPTIAADTDAGEQFIEERYGVTVYTMAAPYGNTEYAQVAQTRYLINRGTGGGQILPNDSSDRFNLPTFIPPTNALAGAFNGRIDTARTNGAWETVLVHGFNPDTTAYQAGDVEQFVAAVNYTKSFGDVWIGTMVDVGAYWVAQKLLTDTVPSTDGAASTWTWTLPDHFPPNHYLRVTVDGGTLSQSGVPLVWDEHGYYEVSLDAGSLTLAP